MGLWGSEVRILSPRPFFFLGQKFATSVVGNRLVGAQEVPEFLNRFVVALVRHLSTSRWSDAKQAQYAVPHDQEEH